LGVQTRRGAPAARGAVTGAEADLRAAADPLAAGARHGGDLRRRRGDPASELLAREVDADLFVMATDVDGVYESWGTPEQRRLERVSPDELRRLDFAAGSMGPKVEAAIRFVEATGKRAAIGSLADIDQIVEGRAGTNVVGTTSKKEG
jgi:Amino acid kinase family